MCLAIPGKVLEIEGTDIGIEEAIIPVKENVRSACERFGLDPLFVASEGRFVAILPEALANHALTIVRRYDVSQSAARLGTVGENSPSPKVTAMTPYRTHRMLDPFSGEQLPRSC